MPKILIVNEVDEIRGMIKVILEAAGFEASTSGSAKEAMGALYEDRFDLVITDLNLPGSMKGEELLWVIKESETDTGVVILTSQPSIESAIECLRNDLASDYLIHPIDSLKGFVITINKALKKRAQKVKNRQRKKQLYAVSHKLKEMNQKLKESQKEFVESEKKDVYDATVLTAAHNINQPLTVLLLKAEMVEEKLKQYGRDDELLSHIESIKRSALKIYDIMDQFKSLSRPVFKDYLEGVKMIDLGKDGKEGADTERGQVEEARPSTPLVAPPTPDPHIFPTAPTAPPAPETQALPTAPTAPFVHEPQAIHEKPPEPTVKAEPPTILIVEDEEGIKDLVCEILSNQGYKTLAAANGEKGFNLYEKNQDKIDLLITDIRMPKLSGIELYHKVRKISSTLPVICLTGYDIDDEAHKLHKEGKIKLLTKPFALKELVFLVNKQLEDDSDLLKASSD